MTNLPSPNDEQRSIVEELRKAPEVALFSHVSPDGDALGSTLALAHALKAMNKQVTILNKDVLPDLYRFLPGADCFRQELPEKLPELVVFVDCGDFERAGYPEAAFSKSRIINIDHHISNKRFGVLNWVDTQAAASGEIIYSLIEQLGAEIDRNMAVNLYTAIVTDTGLFQYSNTTPQTHILAAKLMEKGIDIIELHHWLFNRKPLAQVKLLKQALSHLELFCEGQVAVISLQREDFRLSGASDQDSDGLINHARAIDGVEVAILLRELEPEGIRVALRSNLWLDVNEVAARLGGGGHQRAAGCTLMTTLEEAKERVLAMVEEVLKGGRDHQFA